MTVGVLEETRKRPAGASRPATPPSRYPGRLALSLLVGAIGLVGWTAALAVRLPDRYVAGHWNVTWVGFDVILLASLITSAWAAARRHELVPATALVTAVLLGCDAWFDVTTASGLADTVVSLVSALAVELPVAGLLVWVAGRQLRRPHTTGGADRRDGR